MSELKKEAKIEPKFGPKEAWLLFESPEKDAFIEKYQGRKCCVDGCTKDKIGMTPNDLSYPVRVASLCQQHYSDVKINVEIHEQCSEDYVKLLQSVQKNLRLIDDGGRLYRKFNKALKITFDF